MRRVRVVTDSTADMDEEEAILLGVSSVPLTVRWDGASYRDKVDISIDEFYQKLKEEKGIPTTSQPPVGEFENLYSRLLSECDGIVSIHISGRLSGTVNAARVAARNVDQSRITVIDSLTTSYPLGAAVLRVARLAEQGASLLECSALGRALVPRLRLFCLVDTLEYLRRGGRIGRAQAMAAGLLAIKLIFYLEDGEIVPADRVRTRSAAIQRTAELARGFGPVDDLAVLYGDNLEPAQRLKQLVRHDFPGVEVRLSRIGATIGTHTGPGVIGVCAILAGGG